MRVDCSQRISGVSTLIDSRLTMKASPRAPNITAREAMNGCTSKYCTSTPMMSPKPRPMTSMIGTTRAPGTSSRSRLAPNIPVNAMTDPTERSMPPVRITNVIPTARMNR